MEDMHSLTFDSTVMVLLSVMCLFNCKVYMIIFFDFNERWKYKKSEIKVQLPGCRGAFCRVNNRLSWTKVLPFAAQVPLSNKSLHSSEHGKIYHAALYGVFFWGQANMSKLFRHLLEQEGNEELATSRFYRYQEGLAKLREMAEILINKRLIC